MTHEYPLQPRFGRQKSFYGKAVVREDPWFGTARLFSYGTLVCSIESGAKATLDALADAGNGVVEPPRGETRFVRRWGGWSRTTARHVDEFRRQHGLGKIGKREWCSLPVE